MATRFCKSVDTYCTGLGFLPSSPSTTPLNDIRERRDGLLVCLADPDVPIDTNHLERTLSVIPMWRKNSMFSRTERRVRYIVIEFVL